MKLMPFTTPLWAARQPKWVNILSTNMSSGEKTALGILTVLMLISGFMSIRGYIHRNTMLIPQQGGVYREAAVGQPRHLNPILAGTNDLDLDITRLVYSGLFRFNNELELVNDLAVEHSISEDQKQYTVKIREDANWHDGTPLTADDVIFTIRSIKTADYGSPLENSFQGVDIEKIDDYTVRFILQQPYAPFLANLTVGIAPKHVWENISPKNAPLAEQILKPIGSGPFQFSEISTRRRTGEITGLRLNRNNNYHGQPPYLDEIVFIFFNDHEETIQALLTGKAEGVGWLPLSMKDKFNYRTSYNTHRLLLPQYFSLFFNREKNSTLNDDQVRQALALAVNRETIIDEALQGEADPLHVPIPPGVFGHHENADIPAYDPARAKELLEEAGWNETNDAGIRIKEDETMRVKITTTDWPEYIRTAEIIQRQWENIGVETEIEHLGSGSIQQTSVGPRDYEVLLYGQILPAKPDPYPFWHSTQVNSPGLNLSMLKDETIDTHLEEARKINDPEERLEHLTKFQERMLEINPAVILYRPYYLVVQKDNIRGVDLQHISLPADRFNNISDWHLKTKRIWQK